ncbi:galactosylceramide sulfotransferase-like isoform X1 [Mercenaria mercenaria]|uniref:galactosylceramide sulfotransferase-like isoform X1 n=1 Tax=Mercenaria mercenaria TaxID=6596 RepID=UPI00234E4D44|nr:galactosylceramide sulfotransferase-like isoform X1 [Mercenaria mercenaria]
MKHKNRFKSAPKVVFWISFFVIVLACITFTADYLGYELPDLVPESHRCSILPETRSVQSTVNVIRARRNFTSHVAFLKVHKAGSTTMQNLFFRFGLRHNLKILLPKSGNYLHSAAQQIPLKAGEHYDIFACHTVYRRQLFDNLLPADSVYIGIVREPVSRMISSAYYYRDVFGVKYLKRIPQSNFIHNLVNFQDKYDPGFFSHTRNTMGEDFGFERGIMQLQIKWYLDQLNSQFLLVLIMEKFDESLVMMKRVLKWSVIDIIYLKTNSYEHNPVILSATERAKFRNTNFLDFEIYEYFSDVFEIKLKQMDDDFYDEVAFFKTVLNEVSGFCLKNNQTENTVLTIQQSTWDEKFQVMKSECKRMKTKELAFLSKLRSKYRNS